MSEDGYQASSLGLFVSAARPVLVMMLIASAGAAMSRSGLLDANGRSALARMNFYVFSPCLVLNTITQAVSLSSMPLLIVLLVNLSLAAIVGVAISYAIAPLVGTPKDMIGIFACITTFGNVGNLPLVFASAMCRDTTTIFAHKLGAACESTGIAYASYDILAANLWQFTIGIRMMRPKGETGELPMHDADAAHRSVSMPNLTQLVAAARPQELPAPPSPTLASSRADSRNKVRFADEQHAEEAAGAGAGAAVGGLAGAGGGTIRSGASAGVEREHEPHHDHDHASDSELPSAEASAASPRARLADREPDHLRDRHGGSTTVEVELGSVDAWGQQPNGSPSSGFDADDGASYERRDGPLNGAGGPQTSSGANGLATDPRSASVADDADDDSEDEGGALLGNDATPRGAAIVESAPERPPSRLRAFLAAARKAKINDILPPPALASIVGTVLGCIPFTKHLLYSPDAPLMFVASAINALGNGLIPSGITMLGALLARGPGAGKVPFKQVAAAVVCRLVLVPLVLNAGIIFLMAVGLFPDPDPIFALTALLANATPTAVNIQTMAVLLGHGEMYVASCVFWCYLGAIFTLPTWTWISQKAIIAFASP